MFSLLFYNVSEYESSNRTFYFPGHTVDNNATKRNTFNENKIVKKISINLKNRLKLKFK